MDDLSIVREPRDYGWLHIVPRPVYSSSPALDHSSSLLGVLQSLEISGNTNLTVEGAVQSPVLQGVSYPLPDGGVGSLQLGQDLIIFRLVDDKSREQSNISDEGETCLSCLPPESGAPLAGCSHSSEDCRPDHHVHVGVLRHDQTVVAAQLQQVLPEPLLHRESNLPDGRKIWIFTYKSQQDSTSAIRFRKCNQSTEMQVIFQQ